MCVRAVVKGTSDCHCHCHCLRNQQQQQQQQQQRRRRRRQRKKQLCCILLSLQPIALLFLSVSFASRGVNGLLPFLPTRKGRNVIVGGQILHRNFLSTTTRTTTLKTSSFSSSLLESNSPQEIAMSWVNRGCRRLSQNISTTETPIADSVLFFPPEYYSSNVTYKIESITDDNIKNDDDTLTANNWENPFCLVEGFEALTAAANKWDTTFESHQGNTKLSVKRVSVIPDSFSTDAFTLSIQWNVTWVPPTAQWLLYFTTTATTTTTTDDDDRNDDDNTWIPEFVPYNDRSGDISTFSYIAIYKLFQRAFQEGILSIPLACIEGTTICQCRNNDVRGINTTTNTNTNHHQEYLQNYPQQTKFQIISIQERLNYIEELQRGYMYNRKCAQDLKLFLECGRRRKRKRRKRRRSDRNGNAHDWDDIVEQSLPWRSVPGMMGLDVDPNASDEDWVPLVFLSICFLSLISFSLLLLDVQVPASSSSLFGSS